MIIEYGVSSSYKLTHLRWSCFIIGVSGGEGVGCFSYMSILIVNVLGKRICVWGVGFIYPSCPTCSCASVGSVALLPNRWARRQCRPRLVGELPTDKRTAF